VALHNIGPMQARILGLKTENVPEAVEFKLYLERLETDINSLLLRQAFLPQ
jgi:hypothetical protein